MLVVVLFISLNAFLMLISFVVLEQDEKEKYVFAVNVVGRNEKRNGDFLEGPYSPLRATGSIIAFKDL